MNSLYQHLNQSISNQTPNNIAGIKRMMNSFNMMTNPKQALQSAINQNPQMKQVLDLVQQSGGDPKATFYRLAEQKGVDPNTILDALK